MRNDCGCEDPEDHKHATEEEVGTLGVLVGILTSGVADLDATHHTLAQMTDGPLRAHVIDEYNGKVFSLWSICRALADHYEAMYGMDEDDIKAALADVHSVLDEAKQMGMA